MSRLYASLYEICVVPERITCVLGHLYKYRKYPRPWLQTVVWGTHSLSSMDHTLISIINLIELILRSYCGYGVVIRIQIARAFTEQDPETEQVIVFTEN